MPIDYAAELSRNEKRVLLTLEKLPAGSGTGEELRAAGGFEVLVEVMNAASWLHGKGLVTISETLTTYYRLGKEGKSFVESGLPERRALRSLAAPGGATMAQLATLADLTEDEVKIAVGWLRRKRWADVRKEAAGSRVELTAEGRSALDRPGPDEELLLRLNVGEIALSPALAKVLEALGERGQDVVTTRDEVRRSIALTEKGRRVLAQGIVLSDEVTQVTHELLSSGRWKDVEFRPYDPTTFAPDVAGGRAHPISMTIEEIRQIFLALGFHEIRGDYVHSAFWNMDALFIPQDHPAREMQDTFYLSKPNRIAAPDDVVRKVQAAHEDGAGTGSRGWRYAWRREESERTLLRTHTTVETIRYLTEHPTPPQRIFSVARVFRNEAISYKHLPEFHQIEGVVLEEGASLNMLIGLLREFYRRMGFPQIRIRPAFFPYTEPSLEIEVLFKEKWLELGGAGIFRPEVTEPHGITQPVLAWGLGLERLVMLRFGGEDVRDLYTSDIAWLRSVPQH